jgi:hypothetical protein
VYTLNNPIRYVDPDGKMVNDYFDKNTGKFLGSDKDVNNHNVYLTTAENWNRMQGEKWETKVPGSIAVNKTISDEVATGILNHYYGEAGFDVSELKSNSVMTKVPNKDLGMAEYGSQWKGLEEGEMRISVEKQKIGSTLVTKYDYISTFIHERGSHIPDFQKLGRPYDMWKDSKPFEKNAIQMQIADPSWSGTSQQYRNVINDNAKEVGKYIPLILR